ncbi:hypothetical protein SAMN05518801_10770 [Novosphingobium sp. CF614]|uniref:hypothetical protein n=1 Tax=Novosphingobium sp. CF614 TaxID=1884364 RepID=UPI0008F1EE50|nr:hypothetical protein [Novosphingobium sp. CF614]SFG09055.1 hypothetical protein SAMN05518801_10770 [Novosphingobium sp. CF614]
MTAPSWFHSDPSWFHSDDVAPAEHLRELQEQWDAEAQAIEAARPGTGAPSLVEAWSALWRETPDRDKRDLLALFLAAPAIMAAGAMLWAMLP